MCLLTDLLYEEGVSVAPLVDDHGARVQQLAVPAADQCVLSISRPNMAILSLSCVD